jgi:hypothetical protein
MAIIFANNTFNGLALGLSAGVTTLTLKDGSKFPSPSNGDYFLVTITNIYPETHWEIVKCTARAGNVLTVIRGQEGTSSQDWPADSRVEIRPTAAMFAEFAKVAYDFAGYYPGKPATDAILLRVPIVRDVVLPIGLVGSRASATVASTGSVTYSIRKNGIQIGTMSFNSSAIATFTMAEATSLQEGDLLTISTVGASDATLSDIGFCLKGSSRYF